MELFFILGIPLVLALVPVWGTDAKKTGITISLGYGIMLAFAFSLALKIAQTGPVAYGVLYADALSGFFVLLITVISAMTALYSVDYIGGSVSDASISPKESRFYYVLFNIFSFVMLFAALANNVGIVWVSIEMTTLVSAFLVGFYNKEASVEAAWKYIIICSVGISLALLGIILFYYTASVNAGLRSLNWTDMRAVASALDPQVVKIAFIFILVGYGTKAGIAPMHTWLPDAHSQAVTPISALLSGVLLKTALYAILRFTLILNATIGSRFSGNLFIFFGIFSLALSAVFILVQKDIKRLFAYSSIEHMGIILFGIGIGGPVGIYGALFHMFNHAATKSLMFFSAGNIVKKYKTHDMHLMHGVLKTMPFTGFFLLLGAFALAGMPPFTIFFSEIMMLIAGFQKGAYFSTVAVLFLVACTFGAILYHVSKIVFGKRPDGFEITKETALVKTVFIALFAYMLLFGVAMPPFFDTIIRSAAAVLGGQGLYYGL